MNSRARWGAIFLSLLVSIDASAASRHRAVMAPSPPAIVTQNGITITLVSPPQPVAARGVQQLAWELVIRNARGNSVTLGRLDVLSGSDVLLSWSGASLRTILANVPDRGSATTPPKEEIGSGELAILYLWMTSRNAASVPSDLAHRLTFTSPAGSETIDGPVAVVRRAAPPVLSAPLAGERWLAANGPSNDSIHRRALTLIDGKFELAQRFAIDWLKLDVNGASFSGDPAINASYYAYGTDVLAVADATVASTSDGMAENVPHQLPPFDLATAAGNHVILDLGDGAFALYAHLQPGSIAVHPGDHILKGQVLARIGNSGNSTEPHLHFHVCNANSALDCDGLPYVIDHFLTQDGGRLNEIPIQNDLVTFDP